MKISKMWLFTIAIIALSLTGCSSNPTVNEAVQDIMNDTRLQEKRDIVNARVSYLVSDNYFNLEMSEPAGIAVANGKIAVTDSADNCIYIFSNSGEHIDTIGKTGNGQMQFLAPCQIVFSNNRYYILDSGNSRIQILDQDFSYLNEIKLTPIEDFSSDCKYQDFIVDQNGDIYITSYALTPKYTKIFKVTPNGTIHEIGDNLIGYIGIIDNTIYFANYKTLYRAQENFREQTYVLTYENYLEKIEDDSMEKAGELPFGYNPSDFTSDDNGIFIYSERFCTLDYFDNEVNYQETLYQFEDNVNIKYLAYDQETKCIFASAPTEGKIYRIYSESER